MELFCFPWVEKWRKENRESQYTDIASGQLQHCFANIAAFKAQFLFNEVSMCHFLKRIAVNIASWTYQGIILLLDFGIMTFLLNYMKKIVNYGSHYVIH